VAVEQPELPLFYEDLVKRLRERGIICAITSGLACVHYGVAETTQDCDLLCHADWFDRLLEVLGTTHIQGTACHYRGNVSPPLDKRWHAGGWASHFEWPLKPEPVTLDVFGHALRESTPWTAELFGLYAGPQTVAEMKRTRRDKDWGAITALGVSMLEAEDERGWLHIFDADILTQLIGERECPPSILARRPALQVALARDTRTPGALNAERKLWEELDRQRIHIFEGHLRPYVAAVRKARAGRSGLLADEHALRIGCATKHLLPNPLKDYGVGKYIDESKKRLLVAGLIPPEALTWLPNVEIYFEWLNK
jgi:hypothetical protein